MSLIHPTAIIDPKAELDSSVKVGAYCQIGGAAMFVGHIRVADRTFIGGGTLVAASINQPDYYASSYPLQTHRDWVKNAVHLRRLNELHRRVKTLENTINYPENKE